MSHHVADSKLTEHSVVLEHTRCPKCGSADGRQIAEGKDHMFSVQGTFYVAECAVCRLQFQNPRPDSASLPRLYPTHYGMLQNPKIENSAPAVASRDAAEERPKISSRGSVSGKWSARFLWRFQQRNYLAHNLHYEHLRPEGGRMNWPFLGPRNRRDCGLNLIPKYVDGGRLLELGCATGLKLESLRKIGWRDLQGIEMVEAAAEVARARGFAVKTGVVETEMDSYPNAYFDVITSSFMLEHVYNPFEVVRLLARKLKPGGEFLFSTICRNAVDANLYGSYWAGFDFPRHMVFFSKKDLRDMISPYFSSTEYHYQCAFIDFVRSSSWRINDGRGTAWDRLAVAGGDTRLTRALLAPFSWLGRTTRVSVRCVRNWT